MPDQLQLYDTAVMDFVQTEFSTLIGGKSFQLLIGTADRAFAQFVTPTGISPDGRPPLPRAALTLGDPEVDNERFNSNTLRKLGYSDATELNIRRAEYPVPVNIAYTLNFWTEYKREMNLYMQKVLKLWRAQYKYIPVDIDSISPIPIYGIKDVGMFAEGGLVETGDLEPGTKERYLRRTFNFHMKAWLWDLGPADDGVLDTKTSVKEFQLESYQDKDLLLLFEITKSPQRQILDQGDGSTTVFNLTPNPNILPVIENTFMIDTVVGGNPVRGFDEGAGAIVGPGIASGTVNYTTGEIAITYTTAPDSSEDISVAYFTKL